MMRSDENTYRFSFTASGQLCSLHRPCITRALLLGRVPWHLPVLSLTSTSGHGQCISNNNRRVIREPEGISIGQFWKASNFVERTCCSALLDEKSPFLTLTAFTMTVRSFSGLFPHASMGTSGTLFPRVRILTVIKCPCLRLLPVFSSPNFSFCELMKILDGR